MVHFGAWLSHVANTRQRWFVFANVDTRRLDGYFTSAISRLMP
jgi:hypothetical protein